MKDISIVVAAHAEGLIAHKTLLSVKQAVQELEKAGKTYEIIATLDKPSPETMHYFATQQLLPVKTLVLAYGELASSRNHGIQEARGKHIALLDADDLVSRNWFVEGLQKVDDQTVVHTEYSINFGESSIIWHKKNSLDKRHEALRNVDANQWDSALIAQRQLLKKYPFQANQNGLAPEDWHFNCQTLAAGVRHIVAPRTILYVRRKEISMMTEQAASKNALHYTDLLDISYFHSIPATTIEQIKSAETHKTPAKNASVRSKALKTAKIAYRHSQRVPGLRKIARHLKNQAPPTQLHSSLDLPDWLLGDWKHMHQIEKALFPDKETLARTIFYDSNMYELGICYWQLVKHIKKPPTYILFVPYLIKGGADLVAINYANSIARLDPKQRVLVVATEPITSTWAEKLDSTVDFMPFGEICNGLPLQIQLDILTKVIVQSKARTLHNIHSHKAFLMLSRFKLFSSNTFTILSSAFCDDEDKQGRISGHVHSGLPLVYSIVDKILTDNARIAQQLVHEYGYDLKKFATHYQPTYLPASSYNPKGEPFRILWASRVSKQKRPDILLSVARELASAKNIIIDAYGVLEEGYTDEFFSDTPNVHYKGGFNGLQSILDDQDYQMFLYTSERDGIPNIILEAASRGLPIVGPDVGGIGEVVQGKFLVESTTDVRGYSQQILSTSKHPAILEEESKRLLYLVETRHSQEQSDTFIQREVIPRLIPPQEL